MGGPPVMYMYHALDVPKEVVRGTSAVLNLFQFRIIAYIMMGTFKHEDQYLYICASMAYMVGVALGSLMAARINQAVFSRILLGLMVLCCGLMFMSAAGSRAE
jgi:uncharacterized membrane protein YfcA